MLTEDRLPAAYIPVGVVHASFNVGEGEAKLLATFGPCVGEGFEVVGMTDRRQQACGAAAGVLG